MFTFLKSQYPIRNSLKEICKSTLVLILFVLLLNIIFNESTKENWLSAISLSIVIGISFLLLKLLLNFIFGNSINSQKWTVLNQLISTSVIIFILLVINLFFNYLNVDKIQVQGFILPAITTASLLAVLIIFSDYHIQLKKNYKRAILLNEQLIKSSKDEEANEQYLYLKSNEINQNLKVPISELSFIKAQGNYVQIFLGNSNELFRMNLKEIQKITEPYECLYRTHRSYLVNLKKVKSANGNSHGMYLNMDNQQEVPVSRKNVKGLINSPFFNL